jgi:hypothetical protein
VAPERSARTTKRVLGAEHPDTLITRGHLARWTGDAGDAAAARDQYAALVPICERVFGAEHWETLAARGNLANYTGEAGDAAGACGQYAALLPIFERVLGPEHLDTLAVRDHLASWTWVAGVRPGPVTSTPRWCASPSGYWVPSIRTP